MKEVSGSKRIAQQEAIIIKYLTMLEQGDEAERWLLARWPDAKGGIPEDELERAVAEHRPAAEENRKRIVEAARRRALQKFAVIREHPEIWNELWPKVKGYRPGDGVRYTPEDYAMFEVRLRPYIVEH